MDIIDSKKIEEAANKLCDYGSIYDSECVSMLREDIRGICHRPCIYNDEGKCDMWDELSVPDETEKCDNQQKF